MRLVVVGAALLSAVCLGEVVAIHPGNGVYTNVTDFLQGEMDLSLNAGTSKGGIIHLGPANTYSGTTTLGCGTLILDSVAPGGGNSNVGATGPIVTGPATLRYAGPAGGVWGRDIVSTAKDRGVIFDISNELYLAGSVNCYTGSFVKTGPGTLHLSGTGKYVLGRTSCLVDKTSGLLAVFTPTANGDAPSKGYRGFHVLEGTLVLGENGGTYEIGGFNDSSVGGWTTDAGQEKEGVLEIRGGTTTVKGWMMHGALNGKTSNTSDHRPASVIRLYDGTFTIENNFTMGRNKLGYSSFPLKTAPRLEVYGGNMVMAKDFVFSEDCGANSTTLIRGGVVTVKGSAYTERASGSSDTESLVEVSGPGRLKVVGSFYNGLKSAGDILHLVVTNGGWVAATQFYCNAGSFDILVDGGTIAGTRTSNGNFLGKSITRTVVGTRGATFEPTVKDCHNYMLSPVGAIETFPDEEPRGVTFAWPTNSAGYGSFALYATNAWTGATTVDTDIRLYFYATNAVPAASPVTARGASRFVVAATQQLDSLTLEAQGTDQPTFAFSKEGTLAMTSSFAVRGATVLSCALYDTSDWKSATPGRWTLFTVPKADGDTLKAMSVKMEKSYPGLTFTPSYEETDTTVSLVVTAVANSEIPLDVTTTTAPAYSATGTWSNGSGDGQWKTDANWTNAVAVNAAGSLAEFPALEGVEGTSTVTVDGAVTAGGLSFTGTSDYTIAGGTVTLDNNAGAVGIQSVAGGVNTINSGLASSARVRVNPAASGAGHVKIASTSGLTGGLNTGSGTVELDSLAFVTASPDLVLGPGTLKYTGAGETVPGLTLNAGSSRAAILEVTRDLTLESVDLGTSAFIKTGPGTLTFKGNGMFLLGNTSFNHGAAAGIGQFGDSPADTFQKANFADGTTVIGTVGDESDAPKVVSTGEVELGLRTASDANGRMETSPTLILNNGSFEMTGNCLLGYYNGATGHIPEGGTTPRLVVNGGCLKTAGLNSCWDYEYCQNVHASIEVNGGEISSGSMILNAMPGVAPSTTYVQNGGYLHGTSLFIGRYFKTGTTFGDATFTLNGGTFAIQGTTTISNGVNVTYDVNEGAVLETGSIFNRKGGTTILRFNGGTWRGYVSPTGQSEVNGHTHIYAKKTIDFDTSADRGVGLPGRYWYYINQKIEKDPEATEPVGFDIRSGGSVIFADAFRLNTLDGPIHVTDGSELMTRLVALSNSTVVVDAGCSLRNYDRTAQLKDVVLGTDGTTVPVKLDLNMSSSYAKTNYNMVVTGTLEVRSPVTVLTHTTTAEHNSLQAEGVYTALVYRAENTIDVTKFVTPTHENAQNITYQEVTLASGAYAGWKAIVATITSTASGNVFAPAEGTPAWSAVSAGGSWIDAANWNGAAEAPMGVGAKAEFMAATASNVPVDLGTGVVADRVTLRGASSSNGYVLTGPLSLQSDLASGSSAVMAESGAHRVEQGLSSNRTVLDTAKEASLDLPQWDSQWKNVLVVNRGNTSGRGTVKIGRVDNPYTVAIGAGRVVFTEPDFFARATYSSSLQMGNGTARFEQDCVIPALALNTGSGLAGVIDVPADRTVQVKKVTASKTALIKIGAGDLKLTGNGTFSLGDAAVNRGSQANTLVRANGDSPTVTFRKCNVSEGRIIQGTVGDPNDAPVVTCDDFNVGLDSVEGKSAEYVMNNGRLKSANFYVDYYHGMTKSCSGKFTLNGGNVTSTWVRMVQSGSATCYAKPKVEINGGRWDIGGNIEMGYQTMKKTGNTATLTMNGGEVNVGGSVYLVYLNVSSTGTDNTTADGYWHMNGGTFRSGQSISLCRGAANTGRLYLNGGVCAPQRILLQRGKGYVTFNGGVFAPHGTGESYRTVSGLTAAYVSTNGAIVSSENLPEGAVFTIAQNLIRDPNLGADPDGGFTKIGKGTLVLSGANTFTGPTTISGGVLQITRDDAVSSDVVLAAAGTLDLNGATRTLGRVTANGVVCNGSLIVGDALVKNLDSASCLNVVGDLSFAAACSLDFALADGDTPPPYRTPILLAHVTGTCSVPARVKVVNGAGVRAAKMVVANGELWATLASSGITLVFR